MKYSFTEYLKDNKKIIAGVSSIWLLTALLNLGDNILDVLRLNRQIPWQPFIAALFDWFIWMFLTPLVFYISQLFRIEKGAAAGRIIILIIFGAAFSFIHFLIEAASVGYFSPRELNAGWYFRLLTFKLQFNMLVFFALAAAGNALSYFKEGRRYEIEALELKKRESELREELTSAQLNSLLAQLQPHFLFNTIHSINSLMLKNDTTASIKMLNKLSELLRISLNEKEEDFIPLEKELEYNRLYLDIHLVRFSDRLSVTWDISKESKDKQVPKFILQPVIENTIKHGISKVTEKGEIIIKSIIEEGNLIVTISDNGPGAKVEEMSRGIGLNNVIERLEKIYGDNSKVVFSSEEGRGMMVIIAIPAEEK